MQATDILAQAPLFSGFGDKARLLLAKICEVRDYAAGTPIFVGGMPGESLFVVGAGAIELELRHGDRNYKLGVIGVGDHFGGMSLVQSGPRLVGALATTDCVLMEIGRKRFAKLHSLKPQVTTKLILELCKDFSARARAAAPIISEVLAG